MMFLIFDTFLVLNKFMSKCLSLPLCMRGGNQPHDTQCQDQQQKDNAPYEVNSDHNA